MRLDAEDFGLGEEEALLASGDCNADLCAALSSTLPSASTAQTRRQRLRLGSDFVGKSLFNPTISAASAVLAEAALHRQSAALAACDACASHSEDYAQVHSRLYRQAVEAREAKQQLRELLFQKQSEESRLVSSRSGLDRKSAVGVSESLYTAAAEMRERRKALDALQHIELHRQRTQPKITAASLRIFKKGLWRQLK